MEKKEKLPTLGSCLECQGKIFEFEDNRWGCDTCGSVWAFINKAWRNLNPNFKKRKTEKQNG